MTSIHGPTDLDTAKKAETERDTERRRAEIAESARFRSDERAEKAEAERNELIGVACDGSATCPSPLHVDGCFRSTEGGGDA